MTKPAPVQQRFMSHVIRTSSCWLWDGYVNKKGYCLFNIDGGKKPVHRVSFTLFVGPIPQGYTVDHKCHNSDKSCTGGNSCLHRRCVNPAHLDAVPGAVNTARGRTTAALNAVKTHCVNNHEFTPENTFPIPQKFGGGRACRTCRREASRRYKAKRRAA